MKNKLFIYTLAVLLTGATWSATAAEKGDKKILYWVAPMDPSYRRDGPGKSPMGMDLVPVYEDEQDSGSDVTISPAVAQNLGVRTAPVIRGELSRQINTVGYIDFDESRVAHVHMRVSGWLERLSVHSVGEEVKKGQRLFNLYSPDLVNAQREFLRALGSGNQGLITASRERLGALGVSRSEIARLEKTRKLRQTIAIYAPQDGVVSSLPVREGMYVTPARQVMTLADLSSVWLIAEIFERQAEAVRVGDRAEVSLPYLPGESWQGRVEFIYPSLDPKTRTLRARLRFDNPGERLKPNMYARVKIHASPRENTLSIPLEALIRTGDKDRVIVEVGEGRYKACDVVAGIESGDRIEILDGLDEGDKVVVSGQFLLDSEASLKASFTRMEDPETPAEETPKTVTGAGKIIAIDPANHQIRLAHDPIPALDWPGMTMNFDLAEGVDAASFKPGERVHFDLGAKADGYPITALRHEKTGEPTP